MISSPARETSNQCMRKSADYMGRNVSQQNGCIRYETDAIIVDEDELITYGNKHPCKIAHLPLLETHMQVLWCINSIARQMCHGCIQLKANI